MISNMHRRRFRNRLQLKATSIEKQLVDRRKEGVALNQIRVKHGRSNAVLLEEIVARITPVNLHAEVETGNRIGNEKI